MEYFDFLHLPILVQELIVDKIVHHSPPEDRIRFASSCKYFNELVQNAKPKKIIEYLHLEFDLDFEWESTSTWTSNNSMEELKNILTKCQVRTLGLFILSNANSTIWDNSEFWTTLFEASKFVTKLDIYCHASYDTHGKKFVELYEIMKDLNQIKISSSHRFLHIIPYFPPNVEISCDFSQKGALEVLDYFAEKTKNRPLSFLSLKELISFEAFQQFLTDATFADGAKIIYETSYINSKCYKIFMTFFKDENAFDVRVLSSDSKIVILDEMRTNKQMLILMKTLYWDDTLFYFHLYQINENSNVYVTSMKNPDKIIFSAKKKNLEKLNGFVIKNANDANWLKISIKNSSRSTGFHYYVCRSDQMMKKYFPNDTGTSAEELSKFVNNNPVRIKLEMWAETIQDIINASADGKMSDSTSNSETKKVSWLRNIMNSVLCCLP